ncbi:ligand-gated channel [Bacteroidia bacterium]|nr:ligand-gated channel [Bacteroidia bacterium]
MKNFYLILIITFLSFNISAQEQLDSVTVIAPTQVSKSPTPTQTLTAAEMKNAVLMSDAVKHFSGVTVKDYGGIGGIKTVSVRSLGSTHTAVAIDGVPLGDCQNGQIDLGRISLENVSSISLANAQSDDIFQPAKLIASASLLSIVTQKPEDKFHLKASTKLGSFGFFNPALFISGKGKKSFAPTVAFNGEWLSAKGDYPYTFEGVRNRRTNSDVQRLRSDVSLYSGAFRAKVYYYQSAQGLPGAAIIGDSNASSERMSDKNLFAQASYQKDLSPKWKWQANGKYNYSCFHYRNDQDSVTNYRQDEYYLSATVLFRPVSGLSFAFANDVLFNKLNAPFLNPQRQTLLTALSAKYANEHFLVMGNVLATIANENAADNHHRLSPFISISYKPFASQDLRLRAFYKSIFRLPSFNDLYYTNIGNADLRPENTTQYNVGAIYSIRSKMQIHADAYYNTVTDKIIATPKRSVFIWSMENVGKVEIRGLDIGFEAAQPYWRDKNILLRGSYTYQEAIDVTDRQGKTYGHQIAYTPRFSGAGSATVETAWVDVSLSVVWSGKRYMAGQNISPNRLGGYADMGITLSRKIKRISLTAEMLNVFDKNYEIVRSYPMAGRSFRVGVIWEM